MLFVCLHVKTDQDFLHIGLGRIHSQNAQSCWRCTQAFANVRVKWWPTVSAKNLLQRRGCLAVNPDKADRVT